MEDQGQYYDQCVTEVKECKLLSLSMNTSIGIVVTLTFSDQQISKILSRFCDIGNEYGSKTVSTLLIMN